MPLAETAAGRDDRLSGTDGREQLATSDVCWVDRKSASFKPSNSDRAPRGDARGTASHLPCINQLVPPFLLVPESVALITATQTRCAVA